MREKGFGLNKTQDQKKKKLESAQPVVQEVPDISAHRVLVANRGEIAMRIMRACKKLGVGFTAIYTPEDEASGWAKGKTFSGFLPITMPMS